MPTASQDNWFVLGYSGVTEKNAVYCALIMKNGR